MFEEGEPENMGIDSAFGGGDGDHTGDNTGMDLSTFDKEYILKGLAKLYKKKFCRWNYPPDTDTFILRPYHRPIL